MADRYFSLIGHRIVLAASATTVLVAALAWTTPSPYTHAMFVCALLAEAALADLLNELATSLGGTCVGYALVAPHLAANRNDGLVSLLPPGYAEDLNTTSTRQMQTMLAFFQQHLITNYGMLLRSA